MRLFQLFLLINLYLSEVTDLKYQDIYLRLYQYTGTCRSIYISRYILRSTRMDAYLYSALFEFQWLLFIFPSRQFFGLFLGWLVALIELLFE